MTQHPASLDAATTAQPQQRGTVRRSLTNAELMLLSDFGRLNPDRITSLREDAPAPPPSLLRAEHA